MLKIGNRRLAPEALATLRTLQRRVNRAGDYPESVARAKAEWAGKTSNRAKAAAFRTVRATLAEMCIGSVRCAYCEDSAADEVEHILPKNIFPERSFLWLNYAFSCGPCNGPKGNQYGFVQGHRVIEIRRGRRDPVVPPPPGQGGFLDPRSEDPTDFLEIDLGGTTASGQVLEGTFEYLPRQGMSAVEKARAEYTIKVFGLNREIVRAARENAFGGFRARLREYADEKTNGAPADVLDRLMTDLLRTPHLTVFHEMRRQRAILPQIDAWLTQAPEAASWPLV